MTNLEGFLPCPFCGGNAVESRSMDSLEVKCSGCGVKQWGFTPEQLKANWNRRFTAEPGAKPAEQKLLDHLFEVHHCNCDLTKL